MTTSPGDLPSTTKKSVDLWALATIIILILAVFTRFYGLGDRAVSHDEMTHAKFSWNLYAGRGFRHDPLMHGTLLFEVTSLIYSLFGVSDFTARVYTALTGIALVMTPLLFRKWLGKHGALFASLLFLISPTITYYSRYTRHDIPIILFVTLLLWTILQYLDFGKTRWLYGTAAFFPLMYASKENAYMYTAVFLGLLALPFFWQVLCAKWTRPRLFTLLAVVVVVALLLGAVFIFSMTKAEIIEGDEAENNSIADIIVPWWGSLAFGAAFLALLGAVVILYYGVGEAAMRESRLFDVLMVLGTLTLPLGSALLMEFVAGVDMQAFYKAMMTMQFADMPLATTIAAFTTLALMLGISVLLGLWWNRKHWPFIALIHYGLFFVTYSTFFTWGWGAITGLVGGLAYWIGQQGVERGGQPWYYYLFIGPLYEYLALALAGGAGVWAVVRLLWKPAPSTDSDQQPPALKKLNLDRLFPLFLLAWALLSWIAYAFAGEKMPWLFTHIAFPNILLAAWGLGQWLRGMTWRDLFRDHGWVLMSALLLLWKALTVLRQAFGEIRDLVASGSGIEMTLTQVGPYVKLVTSTAAILLFAGLLFWIIDRVGAKRALRLTLATLVGAYAVMTVRTMVMFNFVNDELATEFAVYAHGTPDVKLVLAQIDDISWRTTGTPHDVKVAYSQDGAWPFLWYMETIYPNNYYFGDKPEAEQLLECPVVIAGKPQWGVVEDILGADYTAFEYKYVWWPIEDYKGLTWERIRSELSDPTMRAAWLDIAKDRDYTAYAKLKNPDDPFTFKTWPNRLDMRFYVRSDLAQHVWKYRLDTGGAQPIEQPQAAQAPDVYRESERALAVISRATLPGAAGRGMAAAPDGTLYVADTAGHSVWHITPQGTVLHMWGDYGTASGQFNEPWDVTVDAEGNVYVADTWNHRIQKFTQDGDHLLSWGMMGQPKVYEPWGRGMFYGPRGIAYGPDGNIYIADTGNKRVQVFDVDGKFLREFGGVGEAPGQMDEPVGIAVSPEGEVFVADTWNRRVQVFTRDGGFLKLWDVPSWDNADPEAKPYLAVTADAVYASDPANERVLAFDHDGNLLWALRDPSGLAFPEGLAVINDVLYVTGAHSAHVMGFSIP